MRYVLVFQFAQDQFPRFDDLVAFEDRLRATLPKTHEVDGHDVGAGTVNFFVFTDSPVAAHTVFRRRMATRALEKRLRVSFRPSRGAAFQNLWPRRDPRPFALWYDAADDPFSPASKRKIPKRSKPGVSKVVTPAGKPPRKPRV